MRAAPTWDERIGARIQRAYADILTHGETCRSCPLPGVRCETAEALWRAHREAESAR
ncbi:MAG: hypothetical protein JWO67_3850 [Streptosporangiaceae bacterium]|nr:hypothetical protein [Streptosporangiaceae bacterium]